ncbi:MAG: hypothetical protein GXO07_04360 [Crenarchaeota archaeon]|nr:hypothetical protein [Thermoproteota archaeon]
MSDEKGKSIKKVERPEEVLREARKIKRGTVILLLLKKDLTWDKYILTIENNRLVSGEPKIPTESDFRNAVLALLVVPHLIRREENVEALVESVGLDVGSLPDDIRKVVQVIPGIDLFIPDKELVEAGVGETVISPEEVIDEVAQVIENVIRELGLEGEVKVSNHELFVIVSKRIPKKVLHQLEKVLEARVGNMAKVKIITR